MSTQRFPIRIGARSALLLRLGFGVRPDNAWVDVGDGPDGELIVSFGRFRFETSLANCASWRIEGPFLWITAIGVRMSLRHRDVSFDGSPHGGVRIDFRNRVRWGPTHVPAIYVAADDLSGLAAAFATRGINGVDARKRIVS
ncbi:MAG TPA: hypothetical protein VGO64_10105 [Candidatus Limnocylindrales bacterium]|nr:hypothetical protein [Candidatus Limnocylindrales bacterium]